MFLRWTKLREFTLFLSPVVRQDEINYGISSSTTISVIYAKIRRLAALCSALWVRILPAVVELCYVLGPKIFTLIYCVRENHQISLVKPERLTSARVISTLSLRN